MSAAVLDRVLAQVREAMPDLRAYPPAGTDWAARGVDWFIRAQAAVRTLVPWLAGTAVGLKAYVERVLNAPQRLRAAWDRIRQSAGIPEELVTAFEANLTDMGLLHEYISGEVASSIVMRHLQAEYPGSDLRPNGKSDYPDLWLRTNDYSMLPRRERGAKAYGAALVGKPPRPVRVPDGLEVKTCRGSIKVDCHHNHVGLHLAVVFSELLGRFSVDDLAVAFLGSGDYRRCDRNTTATTDKFSFNGDRFISLLQ